MHISKLVVAMLATSTSTAIGSPVATPAVGDVGVVSQSQQLDSSTIEPRGGDFCNHQYRLLWTNYQISVGKKLSKNVGDRIKKTISSNCGKVTGWKQYDEPGRTKFEFRTIIGVVGCVSGQTKAASNGEVDVDCGG